MKKSIHNSYVVLLDGYIHKQRIYSRKKAERITEKLCKSGKEDILIRSIHALTFSMLRDKREIKLKESMGCDLAPNKEVEACTEEEILTERKKSEPIICIGPYTPPCTCSL
jgi:hypothetical protein